MSIKTLSSHVSYRFLRSNNDHIVQVQIKERIRFICPFYTDSTTDRDDTEHYIIYRVCMENDPRKKSIVCTMNIFHTGEYLFSLGS